MPGPAPDPNALRRDRPSDAAGWTSLPAVYAGTTPDWPLSAGSDAESELWASLWRKPQAAMWARLDLRYQVAAYVRAFVASTSGDDPSSAMKTAVLRMEDGLGISGSECVRGPSLKCCPLVIRHGSRGKPSGRIRW